MRLGASGIRGGLGRFALGVVGLAVGADVGVVQLDFGFATLTFWTFTRLLNPRAVLSLDTSGIRGGLGRFALGVSDGCVIAVVTVIIDTSVGVGHLGFIFTTSSFRTFTRCLVPRAVLVGASGVREGLGRFALGVSDGCLIAVVTVIIDTSVGVGHLGFIFTTP